MKKNITLIIMLIMVIILVALSLILGFKYVNNKKNLEKTNEEVATLTKQTEDLKSELEKVNQELTEANEKLKESDEIKLLVILDDDIKIDTYLKDKVTFIEDIDRQKYYEDRQYRTIRINKIEWLINSKNIINNIKNLVNY